MTHLLDYQPLNLYTNYQEAAEKTPTVPIIFDESFLFFSYMMCDEIDSNTRNLLLAFLKQRHQELVEKLTK